MKDSGDTYIYDAVKHGVPDSKDELYADFPEDVAAGFDDELAEKLVSDETEVHLWQKRQCWNKKVEDSNIALPTETYRELISRRERCAELRAKISGGEIVQINDFITYNLNIRQFTQDILDNIPDPDFIKKFYQALKSVTILDPTCGSGAFLFAALNILEPLYASCIRRMENFVAEAPAGHFKFFEEVLQEVNSDKHPNQEYFIFKSIILNNLYGVDIMKEAVEIAKLRLFLKLVATVEVNRRKPNMGLEPLPDIDFNIRAGNTLVGFATETELLNALSEDLLSRERVEEFKERTALVAQAFKRFQDAQLVRQPYHAAKADYQNRLNELNEELNILLADGYGVDSSNTAAYAKWKATHQPFHWFTEFYEIVVKNGGFDVIIGNPPYVEYSANSCGYSIATYYSTLECRNLYAFCVERSDRLLNAQARFGMIIPNSSISANKMAAVQRIITAEKKCWISNYSWRPSKLFDGANMLLAIVINVREKQNTTFSTQYQKWYNEYRCSLFETLSYNDVSDMIRPGSIPKIPSLLTLSIAEKMIKKADGKYISKMFLPVSTKYCAFYFRAVLYWFKVLDRIPIFSEDGHEKVTGEMKPIYFNNPEERNVVIAFLSSSLFFLQYIIWSSCQVVNLRDFEVQFDYNLLNKEILGQMLHLANALQDNYQKNSQIKTRNYSSKGREFVMKKQYFFIKYSKATINQIDHLLARYYNFSEEELDFIINYDIKFRMGDNED